MFIDSSESRFLIIVTYWPAREETLSLSTDVALIVNKISKRLLMFSVCLLGSSKMLRVFSIEPVGILVFDVYVSLTLFIGSSKISSKKVYLLKYHHIYFQ